MSTTFAFSDPWREELTPRTRASRRRWTLGGAALLLAAGATALVDDLRDSLLGTGDGTSDTAGDSSCSWRCS